jgi:hypothetical protein
MNASCVSLPPPNYNNEPLFGVALAASTTYPDVDVERARVGLTP